MGLTGFNGYTIKQDEEEMVYNEILIQLHKNAHNS